jgi:hypothetical protein
MIYRFRVILNTSDDVFRDIEIEAHASMEDFHNAITQAFGFAGQEMASFYISNDEWVQGEEIALFDMSEGPDKIRTMEDTVLEDAVWKDQTKMIYIYDFLNMWTFLVELAEILEPEPGRDYPSLMFAHGEIPEVAVELEFIAEGEEDDEEMLFVDPDLDPEDYENLDFDENWN